MVLLPGEQDLDVSTRQVTFSVLLHQLQCYWPQHDVNVMLPGTRGTT